MALEQRGNNVYYYQKHWRNGTCVSQYVGNGPVAELIALSETLRKTEERQKRAAVKREQQSIKEQAALVLGTETDIRDLVKAVLIANGYHQHKRQWRKNRMDTQQTIVPAANVAPAPVADDNALLAEARTALKAAFDVPEIPTGTRGKALEQAKAEAQEARRQAVRKVLQDYPVLWSGARRMFTRAEEVIINRTYAVDLSSDGQARKGGGGASPSRSTVNCHRSFTAPTLSCGVARKSCKTTKVRKTNATWRTSA